jgi:transketolase
MPADTGDLREAYIDELIEIARDEPRLVVLDADVSRTSRSRRFRDAYPDRHYNIGVAEQDMIGVAAGMATAGLRPVTITFAVFTTMRAAEPVRTSICYPALDVTVIGGYAGFSNSKDGATHHSIEDIAITRAFPNLAVLSPSDANLTRAVIRAAVAHEGPAYIRLEYEAVPSHHPRDVVFEIGRGYRLREGRDVTIASYGVAVVRALEAADILAAGGIEAEVLDLASLKPLDTGLLLDSVDRTGAIVVVEDHNVEGGIGSAIARELLEAGVRPRFRALGVRDTFTESASRPEHIREKYGLGTEAVVGAARVVAGGVGVR